MDHLTRPRRSRMARYLWHGLVHCGRWPASGFEPFPAAASQLPAALASSAGISKGRLDTGLAAELKFARCMRSHGFPKFPDRTTGFPGGPYFAWSISETGMDPHSAQFEAKEAECQRLGGVEGAREVSP